VVEQEVEQELVVVRANAGCGGVGKMGSDRAIAPPRSTAMGIRLNGDDKVCDKQLQRAKFSARINRKAGAQGEAGSRQ
jgi:hypothetical protein